MTMKLQLLRKIWPAICGLVVGGLLGGLTGSWSIGALAGGTAWLFFSAVLLGGGDENPNFASSRTVSPWELPDASDPEQQIILRSYGAAGMGAYAELYREPDYKDPDES